MTGLQDAIIKLGIEVMKAGARVEEVALDKTGYDMLWWAATEWARNRGEQVPFTAQIVMMTPAGTIKIKQKEEEK